MLIEHFSHNVGKKVIIKKRLWRGVERGNYLPITFEFVAIFIPNK